MLQQLHCNLQLLVLPLWSTPTARNLQLQLLLLRLHLLRLHLLQLLPLRPL
jgi:hypothetical protein